MMSYLFIILALVVLLGGMGSVMLIGQRLKQDHEARMLGGGAPPDTLQRLAAAVESLQEQVSDLSDRLDFTERLLDAPKDEGSDRAGPPDPYDRSG